MQATTGFKGQAIVWVLVGWCLGAQRISLALNIGEQAESINLWALNIPPSGQTRVTSSRSSSSRISLKADVTLVWKSCHRRQYCSSHSPPGSEPPAVEEPMVYISFPKLVKWHENPSKWGFQGSRSVWQGHSAVKEIFMHVLTFYYDIVWLKLCIHECWLKRQKSRLRTVFRG